MSLTPFVYTDVGLARCQLNDTVTLSDDTWKHVTTVLRLKPGFLVTVSDGAGITVDAMISSPKTVTVVAAARRHTPAVPAITLIQASPKARKLDTVVRLATEVDVAALQLVVTTRSHASMADLTQPQLAARLRAVADAAGEQARRPHRLSFRAPVMFDTLFDTLDGMPVILLDMAGSGFSAGIAALDNEIVTRGALAVMIGAEGGFTDDERAKAHAHGALMLRLGASVMRTEHAGVAAVAAALALCGRFDA